MNPRSETLFHFTKSIEFLKGILANGFFPRFCLEDTRWLGIKSTDFLGFPMVSFCDIPISRISEHTAFYGQYGIGMTKQWALTNKLEPVIYAPPGSASIATVDYLMAKPTNTDAIDNATRKAHLELSYRMASHIKPLSGQMIVAGASVEKDFYQESEWRFVPTGTRVLGKANFEDQKGQSDKSIEHMKLGIVPEDVRYIVVHHDYEIPALVDFINANLGDYPHNALKLLTTRILSLESLAQDL